MSNLIPARRSPLMAALLLVALIGTACKDSTGPDNRRLPGTLLLESVELSRYTWLANAQEILYSTPFDYPYTGPPTRLEVIGASGGGKRTVVAGPVNGGGIISTRFQVRGSHVYFEVSHAPDEVTLYRAPLSGASAPVMVIDSIPYGVTVSPDERTVAWVDVSQFPRHVITVDLLTGDKRTYLLPNAFADRIEWSPSNRSIVIEPGNGGASGGTPFQWLDLDSGTIEVFLAPGDEVRAESSRHFRWEGETPFLYTSGYGSIARYSLATGIRETLASAKGHAVGWSPDFETVILATNECLRWSGGPFGGDCIWWASSVDRVMWRSGQKTNILRHEGPAPIGGLASPTLTWLAYVYSRCGGGCAGDGLYVLAIPQS